MAYTESDKALLASFIMMDILALQAENEARKAQGKPIKYGENDFYKAVDYAERRLSRY